MVGMLVPRKRGRKRGGIENLGPKKRSKRRGIPQISLSLSLNLRKLIIAYNLSVKGVLAFTIVDIKKPNVKPGVSGR